MKHSSFLGPLMLMSVIVLASTGGVLAQPRQTLPPHTWGASTNGLCVGVCVRKSNGIGAFEDDLYCDIDVRNTSTNTLYIWIPPLERRYEIELRGPDGQPVRQLKPVRLAQHQPWLAREPASDENRCLDWFCLKETFDVRTNGTYTLIASVRVNACTNFSAGRIAMRKKAVYFLLPPVTNRFSVNLLPAHAGSRSPGAGLATPVTPDGGGAWGSGFGSNESLLMAFTPEGGVLRGGPSASEVQLLMQHHVREQSGGAISLVEFTAVRTNLVAGDNGHGRLCALHFEAQVAFVGPCRWATRFAGEALAFKVLGPDSDGTNIAPGNVVSVSSKDERYTVFGQARFAPGTNAWVFHGFASDGPARKVAELDNERCLVNMRTVSGAFASWQINHDGHLPFNLSTNAGGTKELCKADGAGLDMNPAVHFQVMSNELVHTRFLVCPADHSRRAAQTFAELTSNNVSYQLRPSAKADSNDPDGALVVCPIHAHVIYSGGEIKTNQQQPFPSRAPKDER